MPSADPEPAADRSAAAESAAESAAEFAAARDEPDFELFGSAEPGSAEPGSAEFGSAEFGSAEFWSAEFWSAEFGSAEFGSAEFGFDEPVRGGRAPRVPAGGAIGRLSTRWVVLACAALVVVGLGVGIAVFDAATPAPARGEVSALAAARRYVAAVNAGDEPAAAAASCAAFADDARAAARSGADPNIRYRLGAVRTTAPADAIAVVTQQLAFTGGTTQSVASQLSVVREGGRWLVCGRSG